VESAEADMPDELTEEEMQMWARRSTAVSDQVSGAELPPGDVANEPQQELIDANDVLKALKAFVTENNKHRVRQVAFYSLSVTAVWYIFYFYVTQERNYIC